MQTNLLCNLDGWHNVHANVLQQLLELVCDKVACKLAAAHTCTHKQKKRGSVFEKMHACETGATSTRTSHMARTKDTFVRGLFVCYCSVQASLSAHHNAHTHTRTRAHTHTHTRIFSVTDPVSARIRHTRGRLWCTLRQSQQQATSHARWRSCSRMPSP